MGEWRYSFTILDLGSRVKWSASRLGRFTSQDNDGLRAGRPGFDSRQGKIFFFFPQRPDWLWGPHLPPIRWVPGGKLPERETDHLTLNAEVKNGGAVPTLPHKSLWHST
jgi:hypothetical protein